MILVYILNSIAFVFGSWTIGLIINIAIKDLPFYSKLSHFNCIKNESTYQAMGMNAFKWALKNSFFKYFNQKLKFDNKPSIAQLQEVRKEMTYSEIGHFIAFFLIVVVVIIKLLDQQLIYAIILFIVNVIFNLYPSLLQQQNKKRIDRILKR
ncbi:MAG: hypothetical protein KDD05_04065 [Psychroserpens sp.]|nr:hypothetical protein [Psychroserpens sp.]